MADPTAMMLVKWACVILHGTVASLPINDPLVAIGAHGDQGMSIWAFPVIPVPIRVPHHPRNRMPLAVLFAVVTYHDLVREKLPLVSGLKNVIACFALRRPSRVVFRRHVGFL